MTQRGFELARGPIGRLLLATLPLAAILALAGCGSSANSPTTGGTAAVNAPAPNGVALLTLSALPTSVPSDNSATTTVTVTAVSSSNAVVPNTAIALSSDTGLLSASSVTTSTAGTATFAFSSGVGNLANRTATITATSGTVTAQIPIQISGSTLSVLSPNGQTVPDNGTSPATVTFIAKNAQNAGVANAAITVVASGTGVVTLNPTSGVTDSQGKFSTTVTGVTGGVGTATLTATAVGSTAATTVNVTLSTTTFAISQTQLNGGTAVPSPTSVAMSIGDTLTVTVAAPAPTAQVTFATSIGTWSNGLTTHTVAVAGGIASDTLTTASAGVATVQALDPANPTLNNDTLAVSMTAVTPYLITLQASPSVVPKTVSGTSTVGSSTLIATVRDATGQPVGNAPVAFSIVNPTGGGETVSPVIAYTAATATGGQTLGQAVASFTSGSLTSGASGVQVRAMVLGTTVQTEPAGLNLTPSGNDASIVIGGTAGSVAFGSATQLSVNANATAYIQAMSVLVADANGTPAPVGTVVNLSVWPIAWSTGGGCSPDLDNTDGTHGTFLNEDSNENLILDPLEDGTRKYYASGTTTTPIGYTCTVVGGVTTCTQTGSATSSAGTVDSKLTPANSAAGTVASANAADAPGTVTTDASGVGMFNLTYGKNSAIWTVVRIRASTIVAGSSAVGEIQFRLGALQSDVIPCRLPDSPYKF